MYLDFCKMFDNLDKNYLDNGIEYTITKFPSDSTLGEEVDNTRWKR